MEWFEAVILGIVQGLTEFLPISSSGHLELGKHLFGIHSGDSFVFSVAVHGATVLSILVVFRRDIVALLKGLISFSWNEETRYVLLLLISMIPVGIAAILFKSEIEALFSGNSQLVGYMLCITGGLLLFSYLSKDQRKSPGWITAIVMGMAQALAVIPGISRSGATISAGLLLGNRREEVTRFSFLMVLLPVLGANFIELLTYDAAQTAIVSPVNIIMGFIAAFGFGIVACRWMITIVRKGRLVYFAAYCFIAGILAIALA